MWSKPMVAVAMKRTRLPSSRRRSQRVRVRTIRASASLKFGREVLAGHVDGLVGNACQRFSDKRNFVVDYNFHVV